MPRSKSSESRPKKRRKTVGFNDDLVEPIPVDDDEETRPESTDDTVETESVAARSFELDLLSISHSKPIGASNMPHYDVHWVGISLVLRCILNQK